MKVSKYNIKRALMATMLSATAVSSVIPGVHAGAFDVDIGLKEFLNSQAMKDLLEKFGDFLGGFDSENVKSITENLSKFTSNISSITTGIKVSIYGLASIIGLSLFKDLYKFVDFITLPKGASKNLPKYLTSLPKIEKLANKLLLSKESCDKLLLNFRSQLYNYGLLEKAIDFKFGNNMVLAFSGNSAAGLQLATGLRDIFLGTGIDVHFETIDSKKTSPSDLLEKINETANQATGGLFVFVYDGDVSVSEKGDIALKEKCSSYLVELNKYSEENVHSLLRDCIQKQCLAEFEKDGIYVDPPGERLLKYLADAVGNKASTSSNVISDVASTVVTAIKKYITINKIKASRAESVRINVEAKPKGGLIVSYTKEFVARRFLPDNLFGKKIK